MRRQVTGGRDGGFDGVFETNGQVQIVEVKYIGKRGDPKETAARIRESLRRLLRDASQYGWTSSQIILAAVFANAEIPAEHREAIEAMCRELGRVTPRFYSLGKLKRQWGMDGEDWDDKIYR